MTELWIGSRWTCKIWHASQGQEGNQRREVQGWGAQEQWRHLPSQSDGATCLNAEFTDMLK